MDSPELGSKRKSDLRSSRFLAFRRMTALALSMIVVVISVRFQPKQTVPGHPILILPSVFLIFVSSIFLHELGHVLAGWLVGMRLRSFAVLRLLMYRTVRGWRIRWDSKLGSFGGFVLNYTTITTGFRWRNAVMVAGGPAVNLLLAVVAFVVTVSSPTTSGSENSWLGQAFFYLNILLGVSLFMFILNVWPSRGNGFENDGLLLRQLIRNDPRLKQEMAISALLGASMTGQRPRDWNRDWLLEATNLQDRRGIDDPGLFLGYHHALDTQEFLVAGQALDRLLEILPEMSLSMRWDVLLEATYFEAFQRNNPTAARGWFKQAEGHQSDPSLALRARAALALVEGERKDALEYLQQAQARLGESQNPGVALAEHDWLQALIVVAKRDQS